MNETMALAYMVVYLMQASATTTTSSTTTSTLPQADDYLRVLNRLRGDGQSFAFQGGYQQCIKDVRYYVFHSGQKPDKAPAPTNSGKKPTVSYPLPSFNLTMKRGQVEFHWKDQILDCDKAYTFGKYKKECHPEGNVSVCTDFRVNIPCSLTMTVWPMRGSTNYNRSLDNQTEVIDFGDL